ncbi:nucleoside hydrolase [Actinomycetes bacterium M1A6_2h]
MKQVLVDTDCGVDDAVALTLLSKATPRAQLRAVTSTWGNCSQLESAANARWVLDHVGRQDVPVFAGETPAQTWNPGSAHGRDGMGDAVPARPHWSGPYGAATRIVEFCRQHAPNSALLCIGPLTNIARALQIDPCLHEYVSDVVIMAGQGIARTGPENRHDWLARAGDTNTNHNPTATAYVASSQLPCMWVGIDITRSVILRNSDFASDPFGSSLRAIQDAYGRARASAYGYGTGADWGVPAHDAVAAACLIDPVSTAVVTERCRMEVVELSGRWIARASGFTGTHRVLRSLDSSATRALIRRGIA